MLQTLHIRNYAIIESVEMHFNEHFNVIIGETGAGKSILLGALSLALGGRADSQSLLDKEKKCIVEAHISIKNHELKDFFTENDLDYLDISIIRREITPNGKSRAFINDTPVTLDVLKSLTAQLIDIHAQQETSQLLDDTYFIRLLDNISKNAFIGEYREAYHDYQDKKEKLKKYQVEAAAFGKEYEFVKYQFEELDKIPLSESQWEECEQELNVLSNAETILENIQQVIGIFSENEINIEDYLADAQRLLSPISHLQNELTLATNDLESIQLKIRELTRIFKNIQNQIDSNDERLQELNQYQSAVNKLLQKHHFKEISELIHLHLDLKNKLDQFSFSDEHIQSLEIEVSESYQKVIQHAHKITDLRTKQAKIFSQAITEVVQTLGMPYAKVEIQREALPSPNVWGMDKIFLLFAPNKGSELKTLYQVGSGGEKSRLMLAVKSLVAKETALPTLIFDEIDTGVSGEVAIKTGELLQKISLNHQVISITHLPQVAAAGDQHFLVYKEHLKDKSVTKIRTIGKEEAVLEIAKMLSGATPSEAAIKNAQNLMKIKK